MYFHLDAKEGGPQYPPAIFYAHDRRKASEDSGVKTHSLTHPATYTDTSEGKQVVRTWVDSQSLGRDKGDS